MYCSLWWTNRYLQDIVYFLYQEESSIPVIEKQISNIITKSTRVMRAPRADVRKFEVRITRVMEYIWHIYHFLAKLFPQLCSRSWNRLWTTKRVTILWTTNSFARKPDSLLVTIANSVSTLPRKREKIVEFCQSGKSGQNPELLFICLWP